MIYVQVVNLYRKRGETVKKRFMYIFLIIIMSASYTSCASQSAQSEMSIRKAELTEEELRMAQLIGSQSALSDITGSIFDFSVDESVEKLQLNTYRLNDGEWELISGGGGEAVEDTEGRIALNFGNIGDGMRIAIQSENTSSSTDWKTSEPQNLDGVSTATSYLTEVTEIEYEKEIHLVVQISTKANSISSYGTGYFYSPEKYEEQGYENVYAVTVRFSQEKLS